MLKIIARRATMVARRAIFVSRRATIVSRHVPDYPSRTFGVSSFNLRPVLLYLAACPPRTCRFWSPKHGFSVILAPVGHSESFLPILLFLADFIEKTDLQIPKL